MGTAKTCLVSKVFDTVELTNKNKLFVVWGAEDPSSLLLYEFLGNEVYSYGETDRGRPKKNCAVSSNFVLRLLSHSIFSYVVIDFSGFRQKGIRGIRSDNLRTILQWRSKWHAILGGGSAKEGLEMRKGNFVSMREWR
ncbi:hypothetical protein L6164_026012 [Bauhinia variegata]|uniref:Uncharacterized protein n=1 Tax=Bauhinia variegata TaxID=167791 RepID=A0ACB9M2C4_BAUVA|nr:hypothetical protein L6164_026012 [Bauhinia variegata]